ncbi:hypothetical protein L1987_02712 [Smallanthus sonchifolius]|uniref:Uncharacterized protein n=1 Tax=Smallanthus sonchifolius TaxID=185202 RepID=A0ACB9K8L3_9ASTR|nr:hypothetical protein L1987_02712 [Smallanthus sonchifolius]
MDPGPSNGIRATLSGPVKLKISKQLTNRSSSQYIFLEETTVQAGEKGIKKKRIRSRGLKAATKSPHQLKKSELIRKQASIQARGEKRLLYIGKRKQPGKLMWFFDEITSASLNSSRLRVTVVITVENCEQKETGSFEAGYRSQRICNGGEKKTD